MLVGKKINKTTANIRAGLFRARMNKRLFRLCPTKQAPILYMFQTQNIKISKEQKYLAYNVQL